MTMLLTTWRRSRKVGGLTLALSVVLALSTARVDAAAESATTTVRQFYDVLLTTMQSGPSLGQKGRYDKLAPAIGQAFDLAYMTRVAVGSAWSGLTEAQQREVTEAFRRYVVATYADRFSSFSGEKLQVLDEQLYNAGTMVKTRIVKSDGEPVAINYLLRQNAGAWQITDAYLTGTISELATRRSEFTSILRRQGIDGLIAMLNQKADTLVASATRS
jgi:phospholipid transport system substrate-binding protein